MAKYFDDYEFACECCGESLINPLLLEKLDILRAEYKYPIYVSSGYRCFEHNEEIGGEINSQHLLGNAADIYVSGDYQKFYDLVIRTQLFDGIGYYPEQEFVHVDVRNSGTTPNCYLW